MQALDRKFTEQVLADAEDEDTDLGELIHKGPDKDARDYTVYADDPRGFFRDVLKDEKLYDKQEEIIAAVRTEPLVTVRGCHGAGKDHVAAGLSLWYGYCKPTRTKVMLTGPTQHQVDEILFGDELARAHSRAKLPGELRSHTLRFWSTGKDGKKRRRTIFGRVSTETARLTGHHAPHVMCVITEAQDERVGEVAFTAVHGNATGPNDRIVVVGNPTEPTGAFFNTHAQNSQWAKFQISAFDHPNVKFHLKPGDKGYIPGGPDDIWVERMRREHREDSLFWRTRVLAEFPTSASDALLNHEWIEAAVKRWQLFDALRQANLSPINLATPKHAGIDVARFGGDSNVVAVLRGIYLVAMEAWSSTDTVTTEQRIATVLYRNGFETNSTGGSVYVDEGMAGGGANVCDHLAAAGWQAMGFNGSKNPPDQEDRVANFRAWGYWMLRLAFESGQIAIPPDQLLIDELKAITYRYDDRNRVLISKKHEIKSTLHRSPDRADALMMAYALQAGGVGEGGATGYFGF